MVIRFLKSFENKIGVDVNRLIIFFLFLYLITVTFTVSENIFFIYIHYLFSLLLFIVFSINFLFRGVLDFGFVKILNFYYLGLFLSLIFGFLFNYLFFNYYYNFKELSMYGRFVNIFLFSFLAIFIVSYFSYFNKEKIFFNFYFFSCFIILISGCWQAISLYLGYFPFPLETRSHIHGVGKEGYEIAGRLTGYAAEPSYFVPFILDFLILSLFVFEKKIYKFLGVSIGLIVMILTFSPSGYLMFIGSFILAFIFIVKLNSKFFLRILFFISMFVGFIIYKFSEKFLNLGYVFVRLSSFFEDTRFKTTVDILDIFFQSNLVAILFGFGPSNYKFVSKYSKFSYFETSNNTYIDILVEFGMIGLLLFLAMFLYLFLYIRKSHIDIFSKFICYALFFNLLIGGIVRADYASSRFFMLIAIIYLIIGFRKKFFIKNC